VIRPSDVLLPYSEFKTRMVELNPVGKDREWLNEWESWDLACSPMDDNERKLIRYGHHLGWMSRNSPTL